jgi:hypothetical protein
VIKGGTVLAAWDARRQTADLEALARSIADDQDTVLALVSEIADMPLDDGVRHQPRVNHPASSAEPFGRLSKH